MKTAFPLPTPNIAVQLLPLIRQERNGSFPRGIAETRLDRSRPSRRISEIDKAAIRQSGDLTTSCHSQFRLFKKPMHNVDKWCCRELVLDRG